MGGRVSGRTVPIAYVAENRNTPAAIRAIPRMLAECLGLYADFTGVIVGMVILYLR